MSERTARFVCVIALAYPDREPVTFYGDCQGKILTEKRGENGFGYDPIFYVERFEKTMAELPADVKNSISHRSNALSKLKIEE